VLAGVAHSQIELVVQLPAFGAEAQFWVQTFEVESQVQEESALQDAMES